ncbi:MAG: replication-associated recombination protein A [Endomicrobiia bacterium]
MKSTPEPDLFINSNTIKTDFSPLSVRMIPDSLDKFVGQQHLLGKDKLLRRAIESDRLGSVIFYGPSGTGKTALAKVISKYTNSYFIESNAVTIGVQELRKIIQSAYQRKKINGQKTTLLLDEIHHFNRTQQDALLPDVEKGILNLIGTTTENPYFYINSALLSRSLVFEFKPLSENDIKTIINNALKDKNSGLGNYKIEITEEALNHIIKYSEGDARKALNALEIGVLTTKPDKDGTIIFDIKVAEESIQKKAIVYDKSGDQHYDHISAFIKSVRGSDPDAALYWLAKMLIAGEDPRFIARRLIILASEDVGNADPQAISVAVSCLHAVEFIGMPEAKIPLAQTTIYLACAPKSNSSYLAICSAEEEVEKGQKRQVPDHLKDAHLDSKKFGHGKGYKYPHNFEGHFVQQEYMPNKKIFYNPTEQGYEAEIKKRLENWRNRKKST